MKNILLVGLGGGIGSMARYLCQKWLTENNNHSFPWSTFAVNLTGCFLIGLIYALGERTTILSPTTRLFLATGICGGFTTFSAFAFEGMSLLRTGDIFYFSLYALGSLLLGILAVFGGIAIIKLI